MQRKAEKMKNKSYLFVLLAFILTSVSCATPKAQISDVPQVADNMAIGKLYVGPFLDNRKGGNADTTILGTKRGGYGNPLGRVHDKRGADEFVREHLINVARGSNIFADRKPDTVIVKKQDNKWIVETNTTPQNNRLILVGIINQLSVETGYSRGTYVNIDLELISSTDGKTLWASKLIGKKTGGMGRGIFEDVDKLKNWLAKTLQGAALEKFTLQEFQNIIGTAREQTKK